MLTLSSWTLPPIKHEIRNLANKNLFTLSFILKGAHGNYCSWLKVNILQHLMVLLKGINFLCVQYIILFHLNTTLQLGQHEARDYIYQQTAGS